MGRRKIGKEQDMQLAKVGDVAKHLCVSERTVYRLTDMGMMPRPLKIGRTVHQYATTASPK